MPWVGNDDDLRSVTSGAGGISKGMNKATSSLTTRRPVLKSLRELAEAARARVAIDAPVSGGQAGAENGVLIVMCGGDEAVFKKARPVIDAYARMVDLTEPAGSGQLTKMVNQICIASAFQGLAEAMHFGARRSLHRGFQAHSPLPGP
ncbi:NAD(P)-dependent oxidoreductase [Rhizobium johnstonii]|uniref:NAD(P)-dependent oxidoreductase n=1 Tax=Rhizobium johnstonii TaxID=3019933 RepID=UPI003F9E7604